MFVSLFVLGLTVGFLSSLLGIGGGAIVIPVLFSLFPQWPAPTLIGSTLVLIFLNSLINLRNFFKAGLAPRLNIIIPVMIATALGAVIGGLAIQSLERQKLELLFASVVFTCALWVLFFQKNKASTPPKPTPLRCLFVGFPSGLVIGSTGLGGGVLLVPLFLKVLKVPLRQVSLYSNAVMPVGTFMGALTFFSMPTPSFSPPAFFSPFQWGQVNFALPLVIILGSLITSPMGVWASKKIPRTLLRSFFVSILFIVAARIFIKHLA